MYKKLLLVHTLNRGEKMGNRKLKKSVIYGLYAFGFVFLLGIIYAIESYIFTYRYNEEDIDYVNKTIFEEEVPVVNTEEVLIRPYANSEIRVLKSFYDYKADASNQQQSLIYYENTYLPNSGVSYGGVDTFDVLAVYDGIVTSIKQDNLLGTIVTVTHNNNMISIYQSLSEISVQENQMINQGDIIGKSGVCDIEKDLNNHLHFELVLNGVVVNPELYYNKKIKEL